VLTLANCISIVGATVVIYGLITVYNNHLLSGLIIIMAGRVADILDGWIADRTKTKSPLGEGIDAAIDKILIFLSIIVLIDTHLLPIAVAVVVAMHGIYVTILSFVARTKKVYIHPSRAGKLGATFEWTCVGLYLLVDVLKQRHHTSTPANIVAVVAFVLFIIAAVVSSYNYSRKLYYKQAMQ
jgi:phosphatidylglycerophosphate synthase